LISIRIKLCVLTMPAGWISWKAGCCDALRSLL